MKCFYHKSDLDGHCSGAIVKHEFPDCVMVGVDYKDTLESLEIMLLEDEPVYVVDFRFSMDDMNFLSDFATLHWIDHHETSINEAHAAGFLASGGQSLEIGRAACELTWEYVMDGYDMPYPVELLGRYDVWDHKDPHVLPFQWGMRSYPDTLPENQVLWEHVFYTMNFVDETCETGQILLDFQASQDAKYAKGMAYEAEFHDLRAIVMNKAYANSKAFDSVYDPDKHDIMVMYGVKPGAFKYTLYCNKPEINVAKIAKEYGGGGHRGAAGFYSDELVL